MESRKGGIPIHRDGLEMKSRTNIKIKCFNCFSINYVNKSFLGKAGFVSFR